MLIAFHKPYGVLSQFTSDGSPNRMLAEFGFPKGVYPIGRLDADSEGLLLLSDEAELNERLLHPRNAHEREYWVQVERIPAADSLSKLSREKDQFNATPRRMNAGTSRSSPLRIVASVSSKRLLFTMPNSN